MSVIERKLNRHFRVANSLFLVVGLISCGQSPVTQPTRSEEARTSSAATVGRASDHYDLERDESRGGHTLSRHIARTDEQLEERLHKERNISAASTWTNREIAEETVAAGLRANRERIENWMRRGERRPNLALHFDAGRPIGRSLRRAESAAVPCASAVIVLRADGPDGFYVLTTYPEARE
jgi:Bacterial CdiA-CT RNAse A domain